MSAVLVAALATGAGVLGFQLISPDDENSSTAAPDNQQQPAPGAQAPEGFKEFRSEEAGIVLSYPANWTTHETADPQILLLASNGAEDSFLVRRTELESEVTEQDLPALRQLTDQIVGSNQSAQQITEPKPIKLAGLPGYFYFYRFEDPGTKQIGAHSHFFLFEGKTMLTLVFQTLPAEKFPESARTFDQITASLRQL